MRKEPTPQERNPFGQLSTLRLHDVRYNAADIAYCAVADGRVQLRCQTELAIVSGELIYNDGQPRRKALTEMGDDGRFRYWEVEIEPAEPEISYAFAFRLNNDQVYYYSGSGLAHVIERPFSLNLDTVPTLDLPAWARGAVIYQIFPERFNNGDRSTDPSNVSPWGTPPHSTLYMGGDLPGITAKLDYIKRLGIEILYLTPIFHSPSNHKYDATDYYTVDPAFGGNEALRDLIDGCHARDIKIILDASFNHCHPTFFAFQDLIKNGADSPYRDWFTVYDFPIEIGYRPHAIPAHLANNEGYQRYMSYLLSMEEVAGIPVVERSDAGEVFEPSYLAWYGVINMPKLNQANRETRQYFLDVARYWLTEFDIDGWRMDVAIFVQDDFWQEFRTVCKAAKPDCYLISEIWGDTHNWLQGDMFDATMNYLLRDIALEFFAYRTIDAAAVKAGLLRLDAKYGRAVQLIQHNLLSSHDVPRFLELAGGDKEMFKLATIFQMCWPGAPGLYYGDEVGVAGGGDPDNRRAFPWHDPEAWDNHLLQLVQRLTALRNRYPVLRTGRWRWLWESPNGEGFAFERYDEDDEQGALEIVMNRGEAVLDYRSSKLSSYMNLLAEPEEQSKLEGPIQLPPCSAAILISTN